MYKSRRVSPTASTAVKTAILVGVTGFEPAASTSQTSRATNCATPRSVKNIRFLGQFRKWSNLWSKHFVGVFLKRQTPEKVSVYKGVFSMIARLFVALLFARSAFLPAGASPPPACSQTKRLTIRQHPEKYSIFSQLWSNLWSSRYFFRRSITICSRFRRFSPDCSLF